MNIAKLNFKKEPNYQIRGNIAIFNFRAAKILNTKLKPEYKQNDASGIVTLMAIYIYVTMNGDII